MSDTTVVAASLPAAAASATPTAVTEAKLERLYERIDQVLQANRHAETLTLLLSTVLFLSGVALLVAGFAFGEPLITGSGVVVETGIIWPLRRIVKLREQNVQLQVLPGMLDLLPPEEAAEQWKKWYAKWFGD